MDVFTRLYNLFFGLTKNELKEIDDDVIFAIYKIRSSSRQLQLAKKLIRLTEEKER
jgi:hypothetical protein